MTINHLIEIAIGCCLAIIGCWFLMFKREKEQEQQIRQITSQKKILEDENNYLKITLRNEVKKNKESIEAVERRQDQADLWFSSIIRHSRAQFEKEAVEKFLDEHGMQEEE